MLYTMLPNSNSTLFALIDCNNFYVSCERVFQPKLIDKPVVVLSNNDGCAIARSDEAKKLGIAMGMPYFQFKHLAKKHNIQVLSSNYALYGDMSARVMHIIMQAIPEVLIYSIDEAFLDLTTFVKRINVVDLCQKLADQIQQGTGIPVSIGIGSTKTIAKLANYKVKQNKALGQVCYLGNGNQVDALLAKMPVSKIWGVGKQSEIKLNQLGIFNGLKLKHIPAHILKRHFTIMLARTVTELQGKSLIELDTLTTPRKQIIVSRSFRQVTAEYTDIRAALANHVASAVEKLRAQHSLAAGIMVFLQTSRFNPATSNYQNSCYLPLEAPSNNTCVFLQKSNQGLTALFKKGYLYKKVGVILQGLRSANSLQLDLFAHQRLNHGEILMDTIDAINGKMGCSTITFASQGINEKCTMQSAYKTKSYTTRWSQLPEAYAN